MVDTIEEFRSRLAALDGALTKGGALDEDVLTQVQHLCTATFSTFERHARGGGEHVAATAAYVTGETLPHLMQSGFMNRARTQPRGYAGDFLTIEMIYRNVGVGDGRMGRFLDGWGLSTSPCIAVRK